MALIDSLISYWKLDEASGNALDAHSTNELTETSGTIAAATGKVGGARDFEMLDTEYFTRADNAALSTGDIDFSLACWINPESSATSAILGKWQWDGSGEHEWVLWLNSMTPTFSVSTNGTSIAASAVWGSGLSTATWYFIVIWHDSVNNQIGISVNAGTPVTASHSGGVRDGTHAFDIGGSNNASFYDGLIDEVGFWKKVLTSDERTLLYNGGNGLPYPFAFTATAAVSAAPATCSGSATFTKPTYTGSAAVSAAAATCSGSATFTKPTYTGSAAVSAAPATCSGSATFTKPQYTATAVVTAAPATCSGSATFTKPTYTATVAVSVAAATCTGSATFAGGAPQIAEQPEAVWQFRRQQTVFQFHHQATTWQPEN